MAVQELDEVRRRFVNEVVRPMAERLVAFRAECDAYKLEAHKHDKVIAATADELADAKDGTTSRTDAPKMTGADVERVLLIVETVRADLSDEDVEALVKIAVRDVRAIRRT